MASKDIIDFGGASGDKAIFKAARDVGALGIIRIFKHWVKVELQGILSDPNYEY